MLFAPSLIGKRKTKDSNLLKVLGITPSLPSSAIPPSVPVSVIPSSAGLSSAASQTCTAVPEISESESINSEIDPSIAPRSLRPITANAADNERTTCLAQPSKRSAPRKKAPPQNELGANTSMIRTRRRSFAREIPQEKTSTVRTRPLTRSARCADGVGLLAVLGRPRVKEECFVEVESTPQSPNESGPLSEQTGLMAPDTEINPSPPEVSAKKQQYRMSSEEKASPRPRTVSKQRPMFRQGAAPKRGGRSARQVPQTPDMGSKRDMTVEVWPSEEPPHIWKPREEAKLRQAVQRAACTSHIDWNAVAMSLGISATACKEKYVALLEEGLSKPDTKRRPDPVAPKVFKPHDSTRKWKMKNILANRASKRRVRQDLFKALPDCIIEEGSAESAIDSSALESAVMLSAEDGSHETPLSEDLRNEEFDGIKCENRPPLNFSPADGVLSGERRSEAASIDSESMRSAYSEEPPCTPQKGEKTQSPGEALECLLGAVLENVHTGLTPEVRREERPREMPILRKLEAERFYEKHRKRQEKLFRRRQRKSLDQNWEPKPVMMPAKPSKNDREDLFLELTEAVDGEEDIEIVRSQIDCLSSSDET